MDTINLTWKMHHGKPGIDQDPANPLSRSLNQLFKEGKPFPNLSLCFFSEFNKLDSASPILRWFGAFVLSTDSRIVYFPGFISNYDGIQAFEGKSLQWNQSFYFDHISLEKDFSRWHVTSPNSRTHLGSPPTLALGDGRVLWFGMSVANPLVMRKVMREISVTTLAPATDAERRVEVFRKAREGAMFPIVSLHPKATAYCPKGFLHFAVIVGPKGFATYEGGEIGFPIGSPFLTEPLPEKFDALPVQSHRLLLSEKIDIQITTARLPGSLKSPVAFTAQSEPNTAANPTAKRRATKERCF